MTIPDLQELVMKKFIIQTTYGQCSRGKRMALYQLKQSVGEQYGKLWDCAAELIKSNPGSTVKLSVNRKPDGSAVFDRIYVCFEGLKQGWKQGCRKVIGFDGCFLKGVCQGELLSAIGRDGNNQIYPVAWAVVQVENTNNWEWFLSWVNADLELQGGNGLTILSDGHKRLIEAVRRKLPQAEHRLCARHIYANFRKLFNGIEFRNLFWIASKASYEGSFESTMDKVKAANPDAYKYLMEKNPHTWSRAFFNVGMDCEAVENGLYESFNSHIRKARKKPILGLLEDVRKYVMTRNNNKRIEAEKCKDVICPNIRKILELNKKVQRKWFTWGSGIQIFEVRRGDNKAFTVKLNERTCSCRMWQLSSIPCPPASSAIYSIQKDPDNFVSDSFKNKRYQATYSSNILPVGGEDTWAKTNRPPLLPPIEKKMPGRPTVKRKKDKMERLDHCIRPPRVMTCKNCLETGHNKTT